MTFSDRFLWKSGDLEFREPCREISTEEYQKADKAIDEFAARLAARRTANKK